MSLKKYDELSEAEKAKVKVMYSDTTTLKQYLYNFDNNGNYHGRQYAPPSGVDEKVGLYGTVHAESTIPEDKPIPDETEEEPEEKPKRRTRRTK